MGQLWVLGATKGSKGERKYGALRSWGQLSHLHVSRALEELQRFWGK